MDTASIGTVQGDLVAHQARVGLEHVDEWRLRNQRDLRVLDLLEHREHHSLVRHRVDPEPTEIHARHVQLEHRVVGRDHDARLAWRPVDSVAVLLVLGGLREHERHGQIRAVLETTDHELGRVDRSTLERVEVAALAAERCVVAAEADLACIL